MIDQNDLRISPMVLLELQYLLEIRKLCETPDKIFNILAREIGLSLGEQPFLKIIQESVKQKWTRDPFDRLIVGQAALDKSRLLTRDTLILKHYPHAVWE